MSDGISVIICCFNSAGRLPETLRHLAVQKTTIPWELILVNNASTDETELLAREEWSRQPGNIKMTIVYEPKPGLSAARKKGVEASNFKYAAFCDDDNWLNQNFLDIAYREMENMPGTGILGSYGQKAVSSVNLPEWFGNYDIYYAVGKQGEPYTNMFAVYGAGMVFRTELIKHIYQNYSFALSDRTGNKLISGGDLELCFVCNALGYKVQSSDKLVFTHFIPANRLSLSYLKKLFYGHGLTEAYLDIFKLLYRSYLCGEVPDRSFWKKRLILCFKNLFSSVVTSKKWALEGKTDKAMYATIQIAFNSSFLKSLSSKNVKWEQELDTIDQNIGTLRSQLPVNLKP